MDSRAAKILRWSCRAITLVVLAVLPWWFGGVDPRVQFFAAGGILLALTLLCVSEWSAVRRAPLPLPMLGVLVAALALGAIQLVPLPLSVLSVVAPGNAARWQTFTSIDEPSESITARGLATGFWADRAAWPISLYAASTRADLSLLGVAVGVFLIGAMLFTTDRPLRIALWMMTGTGMAVAFYGLVQQLTFNGKIYGAVVLREGGSPLAAFVNRNNGAGYLNLCLAAGLALIVESLLRNRGPNARRGVRSAVESSPSDQGPETPKTARALAGSRGATAGQRTAPFTRFARTSWRERLGQVTAWQLLAIVASVVMLAAIGASLSRGAALASVLALATLALSLGWFLRRPVFHIAGWVALALLAVGLIGWVGRFDDLQERAATLQGVVSDPDTRWFHWRDCLAAAWQAPVLGHGLGTDRFVYRLHESFAIDGWFKHAENQYVESLVDGGIVGLTLLLAAVALTATASWKLLRTGDSSLDRAVGVLGLFAITSQAVHAVSDFGLYIPANTLLMSFLAGIVHGRFAGRQMTRHPENYARAMESRDERSVGESTSEKRTPAVGLVSANRSLRASFATALTCFVALSTWWLAGAARADAALESVPREEPTFERTGRDLALLRQLEVAAQTQPDHAELRLAAAQAWVDRFRQVTWTELRGQLPEADPQALWDATLPAEQHTQARILEQSNRTIELEDLRRSDRVRLHLLPTLRHLWAAREACPLLPNIHLLLAELETIVFASAGSDLHLKRVLACAPGDPALLAEAGFVAMVDSQSPLAARLWRQSIDADPARLEPLLRLAASQPIMEPQLDALLPRDPVLVVQAARESFAGTEDRPLQELLTKHAKKILPTATIEDASRWHLEGVVALLEDRPQAALEPLQKATQAKPLEVAWRFDLATAMAAVGMTDQAREHASFCTRMDPQNETYQAFLRRLIRTSLNAR